MLPLEDMLCDACLYKVESSNGSVLISDMCKRCQKKVLDSLFETAEEAERERLDG
jgi:hypothetical protein